MHVWQYRPNNFLCVGTPKTFTKHTRSQPLKDEKEDSKTKKINITNQPRRARFNVQLHAKVPLKSQI